MLFVFAWSSVGLNLRAVYDPVMATLTDYRPWREPPPPPASKLPVPDFEPTLALAREVVAAEGRRRGFTIERERDFALDRTRGTMRYIVRTSRDRADPRYANSYFTLDARTGRILSEDLPTGEHSGNTSEADRAAESAPLPSQTSGRLRGDPRSTGLRLTSRRPT